MNLKELHSNLKKLSGEKGLSSYEKEMYRYIKNELKGVIIRLQKDQIFIEGVDQNDNIFGVYKSQKRARKRSDQSFYSWRQKVNKKEAGDQFTMVQTGDFRDQIFVTVLYRNIKISSSSPHLPLMKKNTNFRTHDFFGLNFKNLGILIDDHIKPHMDEWLKRQLS